MKKNNLYILSVFLFLLFPLQRSNSLDVDYSLDSKNSLVFSVSMDHVRTRNILESMELGHRSQILYNIRVYENKAKFLGLFGDRIIHDITATYTATKDPFSSVYHITDTSGRKMELKDEKSFFDTFFSVNDLRVDMRKAGKGEYYIASRVEMKIIKLMPPLNLISDIIPGIVEKTGWVTSGSFRIR